VSQLSNLQMLLIKLDFYQGTVMKLKKN